MVTASSEVGWMGSARVLAEFGRLSMKMQDLEDRMRLELGHIMFPSTSRTSQGSNFFFERVNPASYREVR